MKVKIRDKYLPKNNFTQNEAYHLLSKEDDYVRVVNDALDPILLSGVEIELISNSMQKILSKPILVFEKPYFWCILHEGDEECSLQYADIYMAYLAQRLKIDVAERLYQQYQDSLQGDIRICYWQKQWLKYVFNVEKVIQLRVFQYCDWQEYIDKHLVKIQLDE